LLEGTVSFEQVQDARQILRDLGLSHWISDDLFSWQWYFLVTSSIFPWVIWLKFYIDRKRIFEVLTSGFIVGAFSITLDVIGVDFMLWAYPEQILPVIPPLFPADLTVIPIGYMIIYQYFKAWKSYLLMNVFLAALFGYVIEYLFIKWNIFQLINWTHSYSFLGFLILGILNKWIMLKLIKMSDPT
jgi:hypothetical protein